MCYASVGIGGLPQIMVIYFEEKFLVSKHQ